jgi:hypothetical protein
MEAVTKSGFLRVLLFSSFTAEFTECLSGLSRNFTQVVDSA